MKSRSLQLCFVWTLTFLLTATLNSQANVLVSSGSWSRLYSDSGSLLMTYDSVPGNYQGNAVDAAGNVYVADYNFGIRMYNGSTGAFIRNVTDNAFYGAAWPVYGLASKANGDLISSYVLGANNHFVHLDTSTTDSGFALSPAWGPPYEGIAYNAVANKLFATTPNGGGLIQVFDGTSGAYLANGPAVGAGPKDIAVNAAGDKIYVADNAAGQIMLWDGVSASASLFASLPSAYGVDVAANGDVWASSFINGTINHYDTLGNLLDSFSVGGANPDFITYTTIAPVPEPSTMALAVLGGVLTLVQLRRTKK